MSGEVKLISNITVPSGTRLEAGHKQGQTTLYVPSCKTDQILWNL